VKYLIKYISGPIEMVGPFDDHDAAEEWAASYEVEYLSAEGQLDLNWTVEPLTEPADLEWWT
jgi:hypothetical protein